MLVKHLFLTFIGVTCGVSVAAGAFALTIALKIIPRMIGKTNSASRIICYENAFIVGGIAGGILSVYPDVRLPLGIPLLILFGLFSGIQVGCLVMALAEIMNVFPIMFRRLNLKTGMFWVINCMAAGKVFGAFWYFWHQMSS